MVSTNGMSAVCGTNAIAVSATSNTLKGSTIVNGTLNVSGSTTLHTTAASTVAILNSDGFDIVRVAGNNTITLAQTGVTLGPAGTGSGGLLMYNNLLAPIALFSNNLDVTFYGSISSAGNIAFTNLVESNIISKKSLVIGPVSYTHLTLPTIYPV